MAENERKDAVTKLSRKLAIASLRYCVSYYGPTSIDRLAEILEEMLRKKGVKL